jgi:Type VI secretion system/phage-baseplate injector OB domain
MNDNDVRILENRIVDLEDKLSSTMEYLAIKNQNEERPLMRFGVYSAVVISTFDIWKQNRIQFYTPILDDGTEQVEALPWASPISAFGGFDDSGVSWIPPAGSKVFIIFENGLNGSAFYIGTSWTRTRGPNNTNDFGIPVPEFEYLYQGDNIRNGYLCGPDDGSQVLPPWNTESYNGFDIDSLSNVDKDPNAILRQTFPNIYGFKTPEKHMMKMVDGDADCNRKWKRLEIMSGNGNWMIFKDDHLHYAGQWAHPACQANSNRIGDTSCVKGVPNPQGFSSEDISRFNPDTYGEAQPVDINFTELEFADQASAAAKEKTDCKSTSTIGGKAESQVNPDTQKGTNPFFKNRNECRPYKGPQTPQNNKCDLPQSGVQILSISGHTFVMDDSVAQPRGGMGWKRGLDPFDFGCNDKFYGRSYWKSATGHMIELNDLERPKGNQVRSENNGIKLKSALGNEIFLCDAVEGEAFDGLAAKEQGILIKSTSNNSIFLRDQGNKRKYSPRKEGAKPESKATNAGITIKTGYGLTIDMSDLQSQEKASFQRIQILAPQKNNPKGPHLIEMQEQEKGGYLRLRAGGNYILESIESSLVVSRKSNINFVQEKRLDFTQEEHYIRSNRTIALQANGKIYLLAGMDYTVFRDPKTESNINSEINQTIKTNAQTKVPGIAPVVVFQNGCLRVSDRVYASCSQFAPGIGLGSLVLPSSLGVGGKTYVQDSRADGSVVNREVSGKNFSVKLPAGCNNISPKFYDSARTNINATA